MHREDGFALLVALLALVGLTALATAGFMITDGDYKVSQNYRSGVETFYAADAAQAEYLAAGGVPAGSATFSFPSGAAASVQGTKLLELEGGLTLYQVSAAAAQPDPRGGGAARGVSAVAIFTPLPLTVKSAFTAPNGLVKNGLAGEISGADAAPPGPCPLDAGIGAQAAVAGVAVPPGGYVQKGGGQGQGQQLVPEGDPAIYDELSPAELLEHTRIDWNGLITHDIIEPDYVIPSEPWPDFGTLAASFWPVIHITSSYFELAPEHSGRGTIILSGDVAMKGNFNWNGLILTGGRLVSDGSQTIEGAMFTGLNMTLNLTVGESDVGNGNKAFRYHSCNVVAATRSMGWLATVPGTWSEAI